MIEFIAYILIVKLSAFTSQELQDMPEMFFQRCEFGLVMKLSDLGMPESFLSMFDGKDLELYPHQQEAISRFRSGESVIVSVPTASGKSLIAYTAIFNEFQHGRKSLYIVPLRALASEKFEDLKKLRKTGMRVGISVGDYDESPDFINRYDVVVCTSEKADSLFHHDPAALLDISLVVADELHLVGDESRGPRLETFLSAMRFINPDVRIIGLSATVTNPDDIAKWLGSSVVSSDFRPVPLRKGVIHDRNIEYTDGEKIEFRGKDEIVKICEYFVQQGGQILIFVNSRKRAEDTARKISLAIDRDLTANHDSVYVPVENDRYEDLVSGLIPSGVCFHHAGLSNAQRTAIENLFREGKIKVLVATPTLAAGINLPARTVIIRDITRFSDGTVGYISSTEVHQMLGRAGRPKYDSIGYGLIYASTENALDHALEYLDSQPDPLRSSMGRENLIRFNTMALISTGLCVDIEGMERFYKATLLGLQEGVEKFVPVFKRSMAFLLNNGFVTEQNGQYRATKLGKAVSDLYIDPLSALILKKYLESGKIDDARSLVAIAMTPEVTPLIARNDDMDEIEYFITTHNVDISDLQDDYPGRIKTAMVLLDWINEASMERIEDKYNIGPGDVQAKVSNAQWISYSLSRLSSIYLPEKRHYFEILNVRITEGIREEIWELTAIPNIGRVRARRLYSAGLQTLESVAGASLSDITEIIGFSDKLARDTIDHAKTILERRRK